MRMMPIFAVVMALGLSIMILGGVGVSDWFGDDADGGIGDEIERQALEECQEEDLSEEEEQDCIERSIDPEEGDDTGFLSFVVGALGQMREFASMVAFLPSTLGNLGVPASIATPIGYVVQIVIMIGLIQIAIQFDIR